MKACLGTVAIVVLGIAAAVQLPNALGADATTAATSSPSSAPAGRVAAETIDAAHREKARKLIDDGLKYLLAQRGEDGAWSLDKGAHKPAVTAMALKAMLDSGQYKADSQEVKKGFEVMLSFRQKDGGIYDPRQGLSSYNTALAVMAMAAAKDPQLNAPMREAVAYLRSLQISPGSESPDGKIAVAEDDPRIGGVGYGKTGQPNLSVLGMWADAMHDAGVSGDDPAMQRSVAFLTRLQNRSESNPMGFAREGANDGGFVYALDESKAMKGPNGSGMRSYGSMTYAGFKSMLYANVAKDDPRIQAAYKWIRSYWRLDSNPNMPQTQSQEGLFYYYHVFAKALNAWGQPVIEDMDGQKHNWRQELIDAMAERAQKDGSWVNAGASRWEEGSPTLATAYAVMALEEALKK